MSLTDQEIKQRRESFLAEPGDGWMYLSFADDDRGGFLGAAIVEGNNVGQAARRAHVLGINPGGQVLGFGPLTPAELDENVPPAYRDKLLDKTAIKEVFGDAKSIRELEEEGG
jgi:hypothetical protein